MTRHAPRQPSLRLSSVLAALVLATTSVASVPALAAPPMVKTQAPGYYRLMLGGFEVTALSDGTVDLPAEKLLHQPAERTRAALQRDFQSTPTETSVNAFLIHTGEHLVLVDTGAGGLFGPTLGRLVTHLRAAGYQPEQVDAVLVTHLHPDHSGGLMLDGVPAFANATVHVDERDSEFWLSVARRDAAPADSKSFFEGAMASMNDYVARGKVKPFKADGPVVPGVRSLATHGHTPGHKAFVVESQGKSLVLIGDLIHVGAVQLEEPGITIAFDSDSKAAARARAQAFSTFARERTLVAASHLPFPGLGHLRAHGKSFQWRPVHYTTQLR